MCTRAGVVARSAKTTCGQPAKQCSAPVTAALLLSTRLHPASCKVVAKQPALTAAAHASVWAGVARDMAWAGTALGTGVAVMGAKPHPHNDVCVQLAAQQQGAVAAHLPPLAPANGSHIFGLVTWSFLSSSDSFTLELIWTARCTCRATLDCT